MMVEATDIEMIIRTNTEINIEEMKMETVEIDITTGVVEVGAGGVEVAVLIQRYA